MSNHHASFMDPITIASLNRPIVFFLTRSDVFTPVTKPILWAFQMLPIYRSRDKVNTQEKNEAVFRKCAKILSFGRNLLIFGEGVTHDVFTRRLKPIKKGAVRIGFTALESVNWEKKIYLAAVGINYSDPNKMRSDYLISYSDRICLNDYREAYESNPTQVINDLTKKVEDLMKEQITHVDDPELTQFHEQIMGLTRKGMNPSSFSKRIPLYKRWRYSQKLAEWLNELELNQSEKIQKLKVDIADYYEKVELASISDDSVYWKSSNGSLTKEFLHMILLFLFMILGIIHCGIPYLLTKRFVEKKFKRPVFWGSVKMVVGMLIMGIMNLPVIFLFHWLIYPNWWVAISYFLIIGFFGIAAYDWFLNYNSFKAKKKTKHVENIGALVQERNQLVKEIESTIPVD